MWPTWTKRLFQAGAVIALTISGISLSGIPDSEVSYSKDALPAVCTEDSCVIRYFLRIGNTGRKRQSLEVAFPVSLTKRFILPISVTAFGKRDYPHQSMTDGSRIEIKIADVDPGKRIELAFTLSFRSKSNALTWDSLPIELSASPGPIKKGSPEGVRFGRFLYAFFAS